jgi:hypothetical protein
MKIILLALATALFATPIAQEYTMPDDRVDNYQALSFRSKEGAKRHGNRHHKRPRKYPRKPKPNPVPQPRTRTNPPDVGVLFPKDPTRKPTGVHPPDVTIFNHKDPMAGPRGVHPPDVGVLFPTMAYEDDQDYETEFE